MEENTNKFLAEINSLKEVEDLDLNMNGEDIFDFSKDDGAAKLFGEGGSGDKNNEGNDEFHSPDHKRGKSSENQLWSISPKLRYCSTVQTYCSTFYTYYCRDRGMSTTGS